MSKEKKSSKNVNLKKWLKGDGVTYGIVLIAFIVIEILLRAGALSSLLKGLLVPICAYVILAVSLNLTVGILGELSLGHAGFMCIGAFLSALFSKVFETAIPMDWLRYLIALLIGAASAGIMGVLIGTPVLRLKGDYLAIVTLGFGEIIKNICGVLYVGRDSAGFHASTKDVVSLGMASDGVVLIGGPQGITGTPKNSTFEIGVVLIIISLIIILNMIHSRTGRAVMAIRDNQIAAESVGINITKYKLLAFSVSAALAGVAGTLYAHNLNNVMPATFNYNMSILVLVFVVLGGIGSIRGSIIASVILVALPEMLRGLSDYRMLIYSVVLIGMMLFNWAPAVLDFRERHFGKFKNRYSKKITKEEK